MRKTMLWAGLLVALNVVGGTAGADPAAGSDRARHAGILPVIEAASDTPHAYAQEAAAARPESTPELEPYAVGNGRGGCRPGESCAALGTVPYSAPVLRSVGACDAESVELLAGAIGRGAAIELCTGHGDASAVTRALTRSAPRSASAALPRPANENADPLEGIEIDL